MIEEHFAQLLKQLRFDDDVFNWIRKALRESFDDARQETAEAIKRLIRERGRLQQRIEAIYIDKVHGKIDDEFDDRMRDEWREEQERCLRSIERCQTADDSYLDEGVSLLELAKDVHRIFEKQSAGEKSRLLNFVLLNCSWKHRKLMADFKQPFDLLAETTAIAAKQKQSECIIPTVLKIGSPGQTRTADRVVNSHLLYQLSYRGTEHGILIASIELVKCHSVNLNKILKDFCFCSFLRLPGLKYLHVCSSKISSAK